MAVRREWRRRAALALVLSGAFAGGPARAQDHVFQTEIRSFQAANPRDPGFDALSRSCGQAIGLYYARLQLDQLWVSRAQVAESWGTFLYYKDSYVRAAATEIERRQRVQSIMARSTLTLTCNGRTQQVSVEGWDHERLQRSYIFPLVAPNR